MLISVVIPAFNEEGLVGKTVDSIPINELKKMGFQVEIIVVDNASEDNTASEAAKAGARVVREEKRGYGNAYQRGFQEAQGDIIVMGDADFTYPFEMTPIFIKEILKGYDFVIGDRLNGMMEADAMPALHRYIGNPLLSKMLNILFKNNIRDTHCGMRAITREALQRLDLGAPGMEFAIEMVIEATEKNLKIKQIPIPYRRREGEAKLHSFKDGWRHIKYMLKRKFSTPR
ncbi:glycosyltransferase family 2 protein [Methanothermobacter tenebrarum]|uniref:Glycosyltransferase family 2 protein n=1 Tax=Methanothermobacter tenebrarum TaxID=680118 RepID=A0A328P8N6_9EURY|nr:glycosyltransferase family 2 protein [Methanothermobacter tenebrarum]MBC7318338.1 glycosyltransferase family 2 protein [Candidatus Bipolaricaulota bacterium]NPV64437.1 glycosyltransferase family 2 protein [Methanobacteriaceae archaeon]RAO78788.1 glycosyltransferase family 2 protein [Methanothermobacter tenebrarum]HHV75486.1 glycosyltransferase family 2 protein [Thermoanaerobacterium sp.]